MSKDKKYSKNSREDFLRYLEGNLTDRDRHRIERKLMADPFEEEAMEGLSMIGVDEARDDLSGLDEKIRARAKGGRRISSWYRVAAVAAVLLALSITYITVFDYRIDWLDRKVAQSEKKKKPEEKSGIKGDDRTETEIVGEPDHPASIDEMKIAEEPAGEETVKDETGREETIEDTNGAIAVTGGEESGKAMDETFPGKEDVPADRKIQIAEEVQVEEIDAEKTVERTVPEMHAAAKTFKTETAGEESLSSEAQQMVRGTVLSGENSKPLSGASIAVKGTGTEVMSDVNGTFSIPVKGDSSIILVADYNGMKSREIEVTDQSRVEFKLQPDLPSGDEMLIDYETKREARPAEPQAAFQASENIEESEFVQAEPVVGRDGFKEYIETNIRFPEDEDLINATVVLDFIVGLDGRPRNITVLRSPGESFSEIATGLLKEGPDWHPPKINGTPYEGSIQLRILFKK